MEELYLAKKLAGALGVESTDYRTRHADFSRDAAQQGALWLGSSIVELAAANALLVVGSVLRKEQPLLAARLRQSVKKGMALSVISPIQENLLSHVHARLTVSPVAMLDSLTAVLKAVLARAFEFLAVLRENEALPRDSMLVLHSTDGEGRQLRIDGATGEETA